MGTRMILDVFTPLPPLMTDIGGHSAGILPHLAERAEVRVWSTQAATTADLGRAVLHRYDPADPPYRTLNGADAAVFNFGNNARFHGDILSVAQAVPGIAVLHDLNLQHFFAGLSGTASGGRMYVQAMRRCHGAEGAAAAEAFLNGQVGIAELVERFPLTLGPAARALAVVTHNPAGATLLRGQTRVPVRHIPLSLHGMPPPPARMSPARAPAAPPYRLIVFGFIGGNRRLPAVLHALAALPERRLFTLDILGALEDEADTKGLIARLGLGGQVSCHGYVTDAALAAALDRADLAINLRFPTMGEASGSQLRLWAHALPSLVTRIGWYATLPEDAVSFVSPPGNGDGDEDAEAADLARHLSAFAADPAPFAAAGRRGRAVVEALHTPAAYAAALLDLVRDLPPLHRRRGAIDLAHAAAFAALGLDEATALPATAPAAARRISELFGAPLG